MTEYIHTTPNHPSIEEEKNEILKRLKGEDIHLVEISEKEPENIQSPHFVVDGEWENDVDVRAVEELLAEGKLYIHRETWKENPNCFIRYFRLAGKDASA
ncbi:MAG: hypothetical protein QOJ02_1813 [Acidobacteriota bacterium]|jgi:hypothetical protein|nr:hypothetical protein [Acidobacteriota bacterium]